MTDDTTATDASTAENRATDGSADDADWPPTDDRTDDLADRLTERAVPLDGTDPELDLADLDPLVDRLRGARVVGLGEATHGTREFFQLKHRLIRLMVERLDCRIVALEANFSETLAIDEYIVHGRGDPKDALEGIYFWTWDTEEVLALIEWLHEFNAVRPLDDRVRFYGVDVQFTAGPARALIDFFDERDPDWLADHCETLATLANEGLRDDEPDDVIDERLADAEATVEALLAWFDDHDTTDDAAALHRRHARALEQAVGVIRAEREGESVEYFVRRDRAMAENLSWVLDHGPGDRVAVWAHDMHLQRVTRETEPGPAPSMGEHLAERYSDDYYVVGFDFADGAFQALDAGADRDLRACSLGPPPEDAATRLFAAVDDPLWVLDLDEAAGDDRLADWFDAERSVRSLGAVYDPDDEHDRLHDRYQLLDAFDGLLFVAETSRARPIERE
jgi:erythromycin esterase